MLRNPQFLKQFKVKKKPQCNIFVALPVHSKNVQDLNPLGAFSLCNLHVTLSRISVGLPQINTCNSRIGELATLNKIK